MSFVEMNIEKLKLTGLNEREYLLVVFVKIGWLPHKYTINSRDVYIYEGAAHLIEHIVFESVKKRLERFGKKVKSYNAYTGEHYTRFEFISEDYSVRKEVEESILSISCFDAAIEQAKKTCLNEFIWKSSKADSSLVYRESSNRCPIGQDYSQLTTTYLYELYKIFYRCGDMEFYEVTSQKIRYDGRNHKMMLQESVQEFFDIKENQYKGKGIVIEWSDEFVCERCIIENELNNIIYNIVFSKISLPNISFNKLREHSFWIINNAQINMLEVLSELLDVLENNEIFVEINSVDNIYYWLKRVAFKNNFLTFLDIAQTFSMNKHNKNVYIEKIGLL